MAGVAGFEPTNARVKVSCLTAWRHPYDNTKYYILCYSVCKEYLFCVGCQFIIDLIGLLLVNILYCYSRGVWPSGKANDSDPLIVGSNPATPAKIITVFWRWFFHVGKLFGNIRWDFRGCLQSQRF